MEVRDVILRRVILKLVSLMKYAVIVEKGPASYGAYVPDLTGCVSVGGTLEEARRLIR